MPTTFITTISFLIGMRLSPPCVDTTIPDNCEREIKDRCWSPFARTHCRKSCEYCVEGGLYKFIKRFYKNRWKKHSENEEHIG